MDVLTRGENGVRADARQVERVVDAYLVNFSDLAPMRELRAAVPAALELAKLNRHESWRRTLDGADPTSCAVKGRTSTQSALQHARGGSAGKS